jgi:hypothetical protein
VAKIEIGKIRDFLSALVGEVKAAAGSHWKGSLNAYDHGFEIGLRA